MKSSCGNIEREDKLGPLFNKNEDPEHSKSRRGPLSLPSLSLKLICKNTNNNKLRVEKEKEAE